MLIGLVLGVLAIQGSIKGAATVALASPLAVLAIPIFDTGAAIIRRKLTGRSIYTTDRGHLHYLLLARGLSSRTVLLCISFLCLVTTVGALASHALKNDIFAIVTAVAVASVLVVTRLFGHVEYLLVKGRLAAVAGSFFERDVNGKGQHLEVRLQGSADWNDLWGRLIEHVAPLELTSLRLDVNAPAIHEGYHARWDAAHNKTDDADLWHADIPLYSRGQILGRLLIVGERGHGSVGSRIATLASLVDNLDVVVATRLRVGYKSVAWQDGRRNGHPHFSGELGLARNE
jgi:UDP-GlcNAc:undecaprenyl-phosphate GlcNAc-1-phosphate transferase